VIIPTISGEGTVFSAMTCGFSKYLAWREKKKHKTWLKKINDFRVIRTKTSGKEERQWREDDGKLMSASSIK